MGFNLFLIIFLTFL